MAKSKTKLTFEQALAKLEAIVSQIEEGKISLEEAIDKYGEGIELISQCRTILDSAEKKIQMLVKDSGDTVKPGGQIDPSAEG